MISIVIMLTQLISFVKILSRFQNDEIGVHSNILACGYPLAYIRYSPDDMKSYGKYCNGVGNYEAHDCENGNTVISLRRHSQVKAEDTQFQGAIVC